MVAMAGYCASKAATHSMAQALRAELRDRNIEVIGAYPGGIDTEMLAGVGATYLGHPLALEELLAG